MTSAIGSVSQRDIYATARFNMVESQIRTNRVTDEALLAALVKVPRQNFVPPALISVAYVDTSLRIAKDRYLMEPLVLGRLIQEATVEPGDRALIVGAGAGYSAALLCEMGADITALESDADLAEKARVNLATLGFAGISVQTGVLTEGWATGAPYDLILIEGMVAELPVALSAQLADRGRLVTVQSQDGRCGAGMLYRKAAGAVSGRVLFEATTAYLPGFAPQPVFAF